MSLEYNGNVYYYEKNIQNDVVGILNSNYEEVVKYKYDSFGKLLRVEDSSGNEIEEVNNIGIINPFRYRSYYYDNETGLYYLNSRYYNPVWGRFINADGVIGANQDILSYNLYAYCSNNPVMGIDSNGFGIGSIFKNVKESISSLASETATIVSDIGYCPNPANKSNNSNNSISAAGMAVTAGTLAAADGPLPIGDILGVLSVVAFGIYVLTETDTKHISATGIKIERKEVYFPENPYDFNPKGLVPRELKTPNGLMIKWMKDNGKTEVFRWDQDIEHSPHYHIETMTSIFKGPKRLAPHYRPGMIIPEPWASVYF